MRPVTLVVAAGLALATSAGIRAEAEGIDVSVSARSLQPGELVLLTVSSREPLSAVHVRAFGRPVPAFPTGDQQWQALVGIDIDQKAGLHNVSIDVVTTSGTEQTTYPLQIRPKSFPTRTLRVDPDFVNPPSNLLSRIEEEAALLRAAYNDSAPDRLWRTPFVRPVADPANSRFGSRSVYNGQRRSPHGGTDFLSGAGTPVGAPNAGRVVVARELYFTGNTVVIDHGLGAISLLAHLSRIEVREGDRIEPGQIVGLVGATGRVTGPHLHWALRVSGARVDPLSAIAIVGQSPIADASSPVR